MSEMIRVRKEEEEDFKKMSKVYTDKLVPTIVRLLKSSGEEFVDEGISSETVERWMKWSYSHTAKNTTYKAYDVHLTGLYANSQKVKREGIEVYSEECLAYRDKEIAEDIKNGVSETDSWQKFHKKTMGEHSRPQNVSRDMNLSSKNIEEEWKDNVFGQPFCAIMKEQDKEIGKNGFAFKGDGPEERYHFNIVKTNTWQEEWKRQEEKFKNGN